MGCAPIRSKTPNIEAIHVVAVNLPNKVQIENIKKEEIKPQIKSPEIESPILKARKETETPQMNTQTPQTKPKKVDFSFLKPLLEEKDARKSLKMNSKKEPVIGQALNNIQSVKKTSDFKIEEHYKVLKKLGSGSFGIVYKVIQINTGLVCAMKIIKKSLIKVQEDEKKFFKEVEILIQTDHPNIIRFYEYYEDAINYYVITEYVSGGHLYETISKWNDFDELKAGYILHQILSSVSYLHSKNIIHRDSKPENLLIENLSNNNFYNIKLMDFGTSNHFNREKKFTNLVGSPYYMAPEVIDQNYNEKCDVWSCGVIMYILLVGFPPFQGDNFQQLFDRIKSGSYSLNAPDWHKVSDIAKDFIKNLLVVDPKERLSATEALKPPFFSNVKSEMNNGVTNKAITNVIQNIKQFYSRESLQQATIFYIVHFIITNKDVEDLMKLFKNLDKNGDGRLTFSELQTAFELVYGKHQSSIEMNKIMNIVDTDKDGFVSYEEFLRVAISEKQLLQEKNLKSAFEKFDINKDGKLSKIELKNILKCDQDYLNKIIQIIDENGDGFVSYNDLY